MKGSLFMHFWNAIYRPPVGGRSGVRLYEKAGRSVRGQSVGSARIGVKRFGSDWLGWDWFGSAWVGSARLGSDRLGSAPLNGWQLSSAGLGSALKILNTQLAGNVPDATAVSRATAERLHLSIAKWETNN